VEPLIKKNLNFPYAKIHEMVYLKMRKYNDPSVSSLCENLNKTLKLYWSHNSFGELNSLCFVNSTLIRKRFLLFFWQRMPKKFLVAFGLSLEVAK
jgi:hypothetical protein